jgi:formate-dependent nitrite reductase cytochrome c552 subunit
MSDEIMDTGTDTVNNQEQAAKTYTQEEFDRHMAGLKKSLANKYERQYEELGSIDELRQLKTESEKRRQEEQIKRGEFEKTLQELAAKKDDEIRKRDQVITEYKVTAPLLDAAAKYRAVAPEQVRTLLNGSVRLGETGEVEVVGQDGSVRYDDSGKPITVDDLVREFLDTNPHFVQAGASTTNTKTSVNTPGPKGDFDLNSLDLTKPEDRQRYQEARRKGLI